MGAHVVFMELSLRITGPTAGIIASDCGVGCVYQAGAIAMASATGIAGLQAAKR